jgi:hypothetical protein
MSPTSRIARSSSLFRTPRPVTRARVSTRSATGLIAPITRTASTRPSSSVTRRTPFCIAWGSIEALAKG